MKTLIKIIIALMIVPVCNSQTISTKKINLTEKNNRNSDQDIPSQLPDKISKHAANNELPPETDAFSKKVLNGFAVGDRFGTSIASAGDVNHDGLDDIVVGAPNNVGSGGNSGRAYIYFGGANMNAPNLILTGEADDNKFGNCVSGAGDVNGDGYADVIVAAPRYGSGINGRAYIYYGGASMNNTPDVIITGANFSGLGSSLAGAVDLNRDGFSDVIVGCSGENSGAGKVKIYFGGVSMNNIADVTMSGITANDYFGASVSSAGDVNADGFPDVIIGAYGYSSNIGRAYLYLGGSVLDSIADIIFTGEFIDDVFGQCVTGAGDVNGDGYSDVFISAPQSTLLTGKSYLYYGGSTMNNVADVTFIGLNEEDFFGISIAGGRDINHDGYCDLIVGDIGILVNTGVAFVYLGGSTVDNVADYLLIGETTNNYFGLTVAMLGDVNDDGNFDLIVGAPYANTYCGRAYLYTLPYAGNSNANMFINAPSPNSDFSNSIADAGDVNNDGYNDLIAGASKYGGDIGRAYIYLGGAIADTVPDIILTGVLYDDFGCAVASAGDVNGDGYSDVIIGAKQDDTLNLTGKAYIYYGGVSMDNIPDVVMTGQTSNEYFGGAVSSAGDLNADGFDDVVIGAFGFNSYKGRAYIYFGGSTMDNVSDCILSGLQSSGEFGFAVTSLDYNADGFSDVVITEPDEVGLALIFYGGYVMDNTYDVLLTGDAYGNFGISAASPGDVNGDGYQDIIVGAYKYNTYTGRAYIYFGGPSAVNFPSVVISGNDYSGFGGYVFKLGDVNGDGFSDVMVSTVELIGIASQGFVYYGGSSMDTREDLVFSNGLLNSAFASSGCGLDFNGDGAADILAGAPGAGKISVYYSVAKNINVNLHLLIDGFYNSSANTQVRDTVRTYLRNASAPYSIIDSAKAFLSNSGTASLKFTHAASGKYYLVVKHRNSIETWSRSGGISLIKGSNVNYDFTNTITKAFGSNMKAIGSRYSIYGGDSNQDGLVDLTDLTYVYNNAGNFATGYVAADLNGDVVVDLTDVLLCYNNAAGFVQKLIPN